MRTPKKKPSSDSTKHSKYKIINWPEYNDILRNRGCIDFIISKNLGYQKFYSCNKAEVYSRSSLDKAQNSYADNIYKGIFNLRHLKQGFNTVSLVPGLY